MLKCYSGNRIREHRGGSDSPHTIRRYGTDRSGTRSYSFNSLGFRGEEYDAGAERRIFACGCSCTIGTGLDYQETWVSRFRDDYAAMHGLERERVNLQNFSQGAASNDYISRVLLTQSSLARPDLVLALFTKISRSEYLFEDAGNTFAIGPWLFDLDTMDDALAKLSRLGWQTEADGEAQLREVFDAASHHYLSYTPERGLLDSLKNILLLQNYCQANEIKLVLGWLDAGLLDESRFRDHPILSPMVELIDQRSFCADMSLRDDACIDRAADDKHPGPLSHERFARSMFSHYESRHGVISKGPAAEDCGSSLSEAIRGPGSFRR